MTLPDRRPDTVVASLLAALATWVTLLSWTPFAQRPSGFMLPLLGACLFVAVSGVALRWARLSPWLVAALQVGGLLLWLQHRLAPGASLLGIPTPGSVRAVGGSLRVAVEASQAYSAPVPADVPEFYPLLIVAGCCTAVLVDLLANGLRRAPLAGLPLLAAYTAPVSILSGGVSWLKFAAAALCYLFLIAAGEQQRLARWGQRLTPPGRLIELPGNRSPGQAVWSSARTIGVTATALAVVAPLLLPTFHATLFPGGGNGGGSGGGGVSLTNPMTDMKRDLDQGADNPLVTVRTDDPDPSYLRLTVLDSFDGSAWRPSTRDIPATQRARGALPAPAGLLGDVASRSYTSEVSIRKSFDTRWLPAPYPTTTLEAPGDWRFDISTMDFVSADDGQSGAGLDYRLRSLELQPTAAQLAGATAAPLSVYNPGTKVPSDLPPIVRRLAERVTAGKSSKFEQAVALQDFFRSTGGFRYSLERPKGTSSDDLVSFLSRSGSDGRTGYCEQFATAMALMGRVMGIPSRVVVGFLDPERTAADTYVFSTHDLHAWPEMYFGGVGWVRFEPTPSVRTGDAPGYTGQQVVPASGPSASAAPTSAAPLQPEKQALDQTAATGPAAQGSSFPLAAVAGWTGGLLLLLLLLLGPRALRSLLRSRRWSRATGPTGWVEAGWQELRDSAVDLAVVWDDRVTLRQSAASLAARFGATGDPGAVVRVGAHGPAAAPSAAAALQRLVALLERARYARSLPAGATSQQDVRAAVEACVAALRAGAGRRQRFRATWLPASLLAQARGRRPVTTGGGSTALLGEAVDRTVRS